MRKLVLSKTEYILGLCIAEISKKIKRQRRPMKEGLMKTVCDLCHNPFDSVSPGQKRCTSCMVRPSHRITQTQILEDPEPPPDGPDIPEPIREIKRPPRILPDRICQDCKNPYRPTSPSQKICLKCKAKPVVNSGPNFIAAGGDEALILDAVKLCRAFRRDKFTMSIDGIRITLARE